MQTLTRKVVTRATKDSAERTITLTIEFDLPEADILEEAFAGLIIKQQSRWRKAGDAVLKDLDGKTMTVKHSELATRASRVLSPEQAKAMVLAENDPKKVAELIKELQKKLSPAE
jgi:hypothetical protein